MPLFLAALEQVWNPVQGGSWENKGSTTTKAELTQGQRIYTEGYPRNWASQELRPEIVFGSEYTLGADGNHIVAHYTAAYNATSRTPSWTKKCLLCLCDARSVCWPDMKASSPGQWMRM